jgi:predicted Zn-dependent peptidase
MTIHHHVLDSGLMVLVEPMPATRSVALSWLLPVGAAAVAADADGIPTLLSEMILRGAGRLDARAHSDALDRLGVQRSTNVSTHHLHLGATMLGSRLEEAMPLLCDMVVAPQLPESALDAARSLALQALDGIEDDPQERVMLRLKECHQPAPFNRHGLGERGVLEAATIGELRAVWDARCRPNGSILAVAGDVNPATVRSTVEGLLAPWRGAAPEPVEVLPAVGGSHHLREPTAQTHLALAWPAPREGDPVSMTERLLMRVLGSGSSSRLFTEVREKRGLCYAVHASYFSGRDSGFLAIYAGSTPQRAQATLDVISEQVDSLQEGVQAEEFARAVVGLKSRLVMSGESSAARAASIASDFYRLGRARTLDAIAREVDAVTIEALRAYAAGRAWGPPTLVAIGPDAVQWKESTSRIPTATAG